MFTAPAGMDPANTLSDQGTGGSLVGGTGGGTVTGGGFGGGGLGGGLTFVPITTGVGSSGTGTGGDGQSGGSGDAVEQAINNALQGGGSGQVQAIAVDGGTRNPDDAIVAE